MKIVLISGARPNFVKIVALLSAMKPYKGLIIPYLVHTGQHYDYLMSQVFFKELGIPQPKFYLESGSRSQIQQIAEIIIKLEKVLKRIKPDLVIVVGDVNSTLAGALAAYKLSIPLAHVEAGLRSFDTSMPEELNRVAVDMLSDYLFTTSSDSVDNLLREGVPSEKIYFAGNVMIDTLFRNRKIIERSLILGRLGLKKNNYVLMTLHRAKNVDSKVFLKNIILAAVEISKNLPVIFSAHPRTKKMLLRFKMTKYFFATKYNKEKAQLESFPAGKILLSDPLGYIDFQNLLANSKFVMTDSGGIQEESTVWGVPCMTMRDNTERPVTVNSGTNVVTGIKKKNIILHAKKILSQKLRVTKINNPPYWDGHAAERIVKFILRRTKKV